MSINTKAQKAGRFLISGICAASTEYALFWLLQATIPLLLAHTISFSAGLFISFTLNRIWVFRATQGKKHTQLIRYLSIALINLVLSNLLINALAMVVPALLAKLLVMAAVACWNFVIFGRFVFNGQPTSSVSTK